MRLAHVHVVYTYSVYYSVHDVIVNQEHIKGSDEPSREHQTVIFLNSGGRIFF